MTRTKKYAAILTLCLLAQGVALAGLNEGRVAFEKRQYLEARQELSPLAEAGDAEAMVYLGEMLMRGLGGSRDELKARDYITRAYEAGNLRATFQLGLMTLNGNLVERDPAKGLELVKQPADQAYAPAQTLLGG